MDYKEKYEAALGRAKSAYGTGAYDDATLEFLFPQLKESEDERVTRAINNMLPFIPDEAYANNGVTKEAVLNWLEKQKDIEERWFKDREGCFWDGVAEGRKQKEQKPAEWSEDEERLINTSISFLKDFADKGYENAVECIDWLKSKLNGNPGK